MYYMYPSLVVTQSKTRKRIHGMTSSTQSQVELSIVKIDFDWLGPTGILNFYDALFLKLFCLFLFLYLLIHMNQYFMIKLLYLHRYFLHPLRFHDRIRLVKSVLKLGCFLNFHYARLFYIVFIQLWVVGAHVVQRLTRLNSTLRLEDLYDHLTIIARSIFFFEWRLRHCSPRRGNLQKLRAKQWRLIFNKIPWLYVMCF